MLKKKIKKKNLIEHEQNNQFDDGNKRKEVKDKIGNFITGTNSIILAQPIKDKTTKLNTSLAILGLLQMGPHLFASPSKFICNVFPLE